MGKLVRVVKAAKEIFEHTPGGALKITNKAVPHKGKMVTATRKASTEIAKRSDATGKFISQQEKLTTASGRASRMKAARQRRLDFEAEQNARYQQALGGRRKGVQDRLAHMESTRQFQAGERAAAAARRAENVRELQAIRANMNAARDAELAAARARIAARTTARDTRIAGARGQAMMYGGERLALPETATETATIRRARNMREHVAWREAQAEANFMSAAEEVAQLPGQTPRAPRRRGLAGMVDRARQDPVTFGLGAAATGGFVGAMAIEAAANTPTPTEQRREQYAGMQRLAAMRMRAHSMERAAAKNAALLASVDPNLYNQLAAGRRLAPGTAVIGGQGPSPALNEVAMGMARGEFAQPPSIEDIINGWYGR